MYDINVMNKQIASVEQEYSYDRRTLDKTAMRGLIKSMEENLKDMKEAFNYMEYRYEKE